MDKLRLGTTALAALLLAAAPAAATTTAATATAGGAPTDSTATGAITTGGTTTGAITTGAITTGAATAGAASPVARPMASGTWRPAPLPPTEDGDQLTDVAAFGPADAWAVGRTADQDRALILHWDGTAWQPDPGPGRDAFEAGSVSGTSGSDLWVAGHCVFAPGDSETPCAAHWDGTAWSAPYRLPPPSAGTTVTVHAVAADDVWVAGGQQESAYYAHWDGDRWSRVRAPSSGAGRHFVTGLAATGPDDVWAAGYRIGGAQDRPLIQHWDGRAWSTVRTPAVSGPSRLAAITALPGGGLWAVGHGSDRPVVLTRAGGTWRHAPRVPGTDTFATGVAGDGHGGVWVSLMEAFPARAGAEAVRTHYAHFDGHSWTLAEGGEYAGTLRPWHLARVPGTDDLWAVGQQAGVRPYAESYGD